ncbi:MAG: type II toxin-antitoxin system RelE/ParE family toxin [Clostridia bacterium]
MYNIVFYKNNAGKEDVKNFIYELKAKENESKHFRIQFNKIMSYLGALQKYGTRIGLPFVRHLEGDLWELRPLNNRIFFFLWSHNTFVLLHHFVKKSQKTPRKELEIARINMKLFIERGD